MVEKLLESWMAPEKGPLSGVQWKLDGFRVWSLGVGFSAGSVKRL